MTSPMTVYCTHCNSRLRLRDTSKVGREVMCPKCTERFVIIVPETNEPEVEFGENTNNDDPMSFSSSFGGRPSHRPATKSGSSKINPAVIVAGAVGGIVLLVGFAWAVVSRLDVGGAANPNAPGGVAEQIASKGDTISNAALSQAGVTDAACEALGRELETAFMSKQVSLIAPHFDWSQFAAIVLSGLDVSARNAADFTAGMRNSAEAPTGMLGSIMGRLGENGTVRFLRVRNVTEGKRVLLRILFEDGGVNYIEWVPTMSSGQLKIVDGYVYLSGELFSTTVRRITVPMLAGLQPSLVQRLNGAEREAMAYLKTIEQISAATQGGRFAEVISLYQQLPESLKKEKAFMLQWLTASQSAGEAQYLQALEAFRTQFPNDVALDFILLDYQALNEDFQGAADGLRRLESSMGGDSHLHSLLAMQLIQLGQLADARKTAEEAMQMDSDLTTPIQILVQISCKEQQYDEALMLMKRMLDAYELEFLEMQNDPDFAGFVASPQFTEWQEYRASKN